MTTAQKIDHRYHTGMMPKQAERTLLECLLEGRKVAAQEAHEALRKLVGNKANLTFRCKRVAVLVLRSKGNSRELVELLEVVIGVNATEKALESFKKHFAVPRDAQRIRKYREDDAFA